MDWEQLQQRAARQGGARAAHDAAALGTTWDALVSRARRQHWPRLHRGAVLLPGTVLDDRAEETSALAAVGPHAVLGRLSAVHRAGGHDARPGRLQLWVPRGHRATPVTRLDVRLRRVETRRTTTLRPEHLVTGADGIRRTTVARGLVDLGGTMRPARLRLLVIDAVQRRLNSALQIGRRWSLLLVNWRRISTGPDGLLREVARRLADADHHRAPAVAA